MTDEAREAAREQRERGDQRVTAARLRPKPYWLAVLGLALMVPAAMVGTWAYVLVAGATTTAFAFMPWGASADARTKAHAR